jgi:uncharacterized protein (TIGR02453 family)
LLDFLKNIDLTMDFEKAFDFLKKLARNNNREWFEKNKPTFLDIKESFEEFIAELHHDVTEFDRSLAGQDPKKLVFRIYRDVRFSKDKLPYKKYISAGLSSQGKGIGTPGYYLQIEPGNKSFVGVGWYSPPPEMLSKIRQEIDYNGEALQKIFSDKKFKRMFNSFWDGDALKTAPKGYPKDHQYIEWLKLRSFILFHTFTDEEVISKKFLRELVNTMKTGKSLNDFLAHAAD